MSRRPYCAVVLLVTTVVQPLPVAAQDQTTAAVEPIVLRYAFKGSLLLARTPDDPRLFPDRTTTTGFWRFRVEPTAHFGAGVSVEAAVEQRVQAFSSPLQRGGGILPLLSAPAPYRIAQLDWRVASGAHAEWRTEIDRAALHVHLSRADVTVGRLAIGWGRGVMFGAVDLFAPFTPLEPDREWRRGVDGARADIKLGNRVSLDSVAALGGSARRSAFASRVRGYAGKADVEVLAGYRAGDAFAGATTSAALGDFEVHAEVAVFRVDAVATSTAFRADRSVAKLVAGGSYRVPIAKGILTYAEYHYSGFGGSSPAEIVRNLQDASFEARYLRGDTQILGRHAVAVLTSYEQSPELLLSGQWLHSLTDGSGIVAPSITCTANDRWSVLVTGYVPYGSAPEGPFVRSEFGASPIAAFAQMRVYW